MANITAPRHDERQTGELVHVKLAAVKAYAGALLTFNAAGFAESAVASRPLAGVAIETVDNSTASGGAAGAKNIRVWRTGVFTFVGTGFVAADAGKEVFASDDQTVVIGGTGAGRIPVGRIVEVLSATQVRVQINLFGTATAA